MDKQRLKQFNDQAKAIESRGQTKVTRVGDRDNEYGFQELIEPDGSRRRAGVKTYNAEIPSGTPVLATDRSDGLTAVSSLKATPSSKLVPKIFGYPEPKKQTIDLWGLGLQDIGGETGNRKLFLLNLKNGPSYPIAEWPKKIPACPPDWPDPDDYPDGAYPNWEVSYSYTLTVEYYGYQSANTNGIKVFNIHGLGEYSNYAPVGSFFGLVYSVSDYGFAVWKLKHSIYLVDSGGDNDPSYSSTNSPFGTRNPVISNVAIADMRGGPPGNPEPPDPNNPPPPRNNEAAYTLSLTNQGVPIVRLRHTPQCEGYEYDFDKYFKLEPIGGNLQIKDYPGNSILGNWRNDPPNFRCQGNLSTNPFIEFSRDRSFYWYAEPAIGSYTRPQSMTLNAAPIEIRVTKVFTPAFGACLLTGNNPQTIYSIYTGNARPPNLDLISIAGYEI